MATPKVCKKCFKHTHFTRMSMINYYDLCYDCRKREDDYRNKLFVGLTEEEYDDLKGLLENLDNYGSDWLTDESEEAYNKAIKILDNAELI